MSQQDPQRVFDALGSRFAQVGIVVEDLDRALAAHAGQGPWLLWTYEPSFVSDLQAGGRAADFAFRIALNTAEPQVEFIQPLDDRSPYARWLAVGGSGIHHLGFLVPDVKAAEAQMRDAGFDVILSGSGYGADGTGGFCYFDTVAALGYIAEAIERPGERRPPEEVRQ